MSHSKRRAFHLVGLALAISAATAWAQAPANEPARSSPPVSYASVNELNNILGPLQQTAQNLHADLSAMRIDKWKTDSSTKRQTQQNVESIQRNLQSALPEILTQLNNSPEDLGVSFKLYRNLDALYDVFGAVLESAGAFGSKDEFQNLSNDMSALESTRRSLGERVQNLAAAKENELTRLRGQVKAMLASPPPPPKKTIVDDTEPPKKPAKKKLAKPAKPAPAPTQSSTPPPSR